MRLLVAVVLSSLAAGLLVIGSLFFAFYGYCEDSCAGPDRTFWGAASVASPFAVIALALLTVAVSRVMRRPRALPAFALAVLLAVLFVAGLVGLVALLAAMDQTSETGPVLVGLAVLIPLWDAATVLIARR